MLFNMFNGREETGKKNIQYAELQEIENVVVKHYRKNHSLVIILCGDIVDNYDLFLSNLSISFYNAGITNEQKIERKGLLSILSGDINPESLIREVCGESGSKGSICYLTGIHQYEYDKTSSNQVLKYIQNRLINNRLDRILVLNIPLVVCDYIEEFYPDLWSCSIRYVKSLNRTSQLYCKGLKRNDSKMNTSSLSDDTLVVKNRRAEPAEVLKPWYVRNTSLLAKEKDGMALLLKNSRAQFELAALPISKRLCWKLNMFYSTGKIDFQLEMRLVYSDKFSESNPTVGIVVDNADNKLNCAISNSKFCEQTIKNDSEIRILFIVKEVYKNNNESAAAAAIEGFIRLLDLLKPTDVL